MPWLRYVVVSEVYERAETTVKVACWLACWRPTESLMQEGRWWDAHEELEELWRKMPASPRRQAVRSLIQLAAACHKPTQFQHLTASCRGLRLERGMESLLKKSARGWSSPPSNALHSWVEELTAHAWTALRRWHQSGVAQPVEPPRWLIEPEALRVWWDVTRLPTPST